MRAWWSSRSARERSFLITGGGAVVLLLAFAVAWLPLERSRTRIASEVPRLSASLAAMQRQAAEVARVRSMPAVANAASAPLAAAAPAIGKGLPGAQVAAIDDKRVRITGSDVPYGALLEALAAAQSGYGLRVDTARIDALGGAGRVRAELVLSRP